MQNYCARFLTLTGHFFLKALLLFVLLIITSCTSNEIEIAKRLEHNCGSTILIVFFANSPYTSAMPEAIFNLPSTAAGRFHATEDIETSFNHVSNFLRNADQAGKLLFLILPETEEFSGVRDHLVIKINSSGIPISAQPELDSLFLADSLWEEPLNRQATILELSALFKPDIIFEYIPEDTPAIEISITEYWHQFAEEENISAALFAYNSDELGDSELLRNGWGVFTGKGFTKTILNGLNIQNFLTTVKLLANMNWSYTNDGYPAIQALENAEIK